MTCNHAYDVSTVEGIRRRDAEQTWLRIPAAFRDAMASEPTVARWCDRAAAGFAARTGGNADEVIRSLLLHGVTGAGKTWQAYGAIRHITSRTPAEWLASTAADLFDDLRPSGDRDVRGEYKRWSGVPLLLIDDLGATKDSLWTEQLLDRLLNHREAWLLPTIITTNLPPRSRSGPSLETGLSARAFSRLAKFDEVRMEGPDRRRPLRRPS